MNLTVAKKPTVKLSNRYRPARAEAVDGSIDKSKIESAERVGGVYPPYKGVLHTPPSPVVCAEGVKKVTADDVVALAATLSLTARKEVLARLALDVQKGSGRDRDLDMWAEAVYRALASANGSADGAGVGPLPLRRLLAADEHWAAVRDFMHSARYDEFTVTERASTYQMLANMLVEHAQSVAARSSAALSAKFVANCSRNLAAIFNAQFPGYVKNSLAPLVARRYMQGGAE